MIEIIIRILLALFMGLGVSSQAVSPPIDQPPAAIEEGMFISPTIIDDVQALILESFPAQITLQVNGSQPDGCEYPVIVTQHREGNTVTVEIYREANAAAMCAAVLVPYNEGIKLDGTFEPGTYTIHVNDFTMEVTV